MLYIKDMTTTKFECSSHQTGFHTFNYFYHFSWLTQLGTHRLFSDVRTADCPHRCLTLVRPKTFGNSTQNYSQIMHKLISMLEKRVVFLKENGHCVGRSSSICVTKSKFGRYCNLTPVRMTFLLLCYKILFFV